MLALKLLEGEFSEGDTATVDARDGELVFKKGSAKKGKPPAREKAAA